MLPSTAQDVNTVIYKHKIFFIVTNTFQAKAGNQNHLHPMEYENNEELLN